MKKIGILLGGGISKSGGLSYNAKNRVIKALQLLKKNEIQKLILSGKSSFKEPKKTEAKLYQEYLLKHGIKKNRLILEEQSKDTIGNAIFSKKIIIEKKYPKQIVIITNKYHLKRALLVFNHIFGKTYKINSSKSHHLIIYSLFKKLKEKKILKATKILLSKIPIGDHKKAEKVIKKSLSMYSQ